MGKPWRLGGPVFVFGLISIPLLLASCAGASPATGHATTGTTPPVVTSARCAANRAAGPMTFVSPFLYDASAGIIDVVDAQSLGYFSQLCITVRIEIPSEASSPYEIVAAGRGTVTGEGSAADDLVGVAHGANLVAIATYADTSDYALLTRPQITKLSDLDNKLLGYHTVLPVVLSEMLKSGGADLAKITEVNDTSYDPRILLAKEPGYSALQAYQSNEPLTLAADGDLPGKAFREWTPAQFGVKGTFNVQVVNGTFLKDHRATVADFLRAELHATDYCIAHESACVTLEQAAATKAGYPATISHDLAEWKFEAGLITHHGLAGRGIGVETTAEWAPEAAALEKYGLVKSTPDVAKVEDTTLAASLYHGTSLIWP
jgi:NitT/TauT family transport system substrate-binding protein